MKIDEDAVVSEAEFTSDCRGETNQSHSSVKEKKLQRVELSQERSEVTTLSRSDTEIGGPVISNLPE